MAVQPEFDLTIAPDQQLEADTRALYDALSELIRIYQFRDRDQICCYGISVTQCYALEALARRQAMNLNELAKGLFLDKSTMSRVIDALERKHLVTRRSDPDDGRILQLKITAKGRELHSKCMSGILEEEREILRPFDPPTRLAMARLIRQLAQAADERMARSSGICEAERSARNHDHLSSGG